MDDEHAYLAIFSRWCGKWAKDHTPDSCNLKRFTDGWRKHRETRNDT